MAIFPTITQQELESVGVVGLPDTPSMTARAMQEKFEETARSLLAPKFNALAAQLEGPGGAAVGAAVPEGPVSYTHLAAAQHHAALRFRAVLIAGQPPVQDGVAHDGAGRAAHLAVSGVRPIGCLLYTSRRSGPPSHRNGRRRQCCR